MGKILAFTNQKGGTGKTTLSANLAVLWSNSQYKVAVIYVDNQKSISNWIEARKNTTGKNISDLMCFLTINIILVKVLRI